MTVEELAQLLRDVDPGLEVRLGDSSTGCRGIEVRRDRESPGTMVLIVLQG